MLFGKSFLILATVSAASTMVAASEDSFIAERAILAEANDAFANRKIRRTFGTEASNHFNKRDLQNGTPSARLRRRGVIPESSSSEVIERREIDLEALSLLKRATTALSSGLSGPVYGVENGLNGVVINGEGLVSNLVNTVDPLKQVVGGVSYTANGGVVNGEIAVNNLLGGIGLLGKRMKEINKRDLTAHEVKHIKRQADRLTGAVYGIENGLNGVVVNVGGVLKNLANNLDMATVVKRANDLGNTLNNIVLGTEHHANGAVVSADQAVNPTVAALGSPQLSAGVFGALAGVNSAVVGTENGVNSVVGLVTSNLHKRDLNYLSERAQELSGLVDGITNGLNGGVVGTELTVNQLLQNLHLVQKRAQSLAGTLNGIVLGTEHHANGAVVSADQAVNPTVAALGSPQLSAGVFGALAGVNSAVVGTENAVNSVVGTVTNNIPA